MTAILPWQDKLEDKVKIESLLEAIDKKDNLHEAVKVFNGEINGRVIRQLCGLAEKLDEQELFEFSRKIRIYYALSCLTKQDKYLDLCLDTIRNAILVGAVAGLSLRSDGKNGAGGSSGTPARARQLGRRLERYASILHGARRNGAECGGEAGRTKSCRGSCEKDSGQSDRAGQRGQRRRAGIF